MEGESEGSVYVRVRLCVRRRVCVRTFPRRVSKTCVCVCVCGCVCNPSGFTV